MLISELIILVSFTAIVSGPLLYFKYTPSKKEVELEKSYHQTIKEGKQPDQWQESAFIRKKYLKLYIYLFYLGLIFLVLGKFLEMFGV